MASRRRPGDQGGPAHNSSNHQQHQQHGRSGMMRSGVSGASTSSFQKSSSSDALGPSSSSAAGPSTAYADLVHQWARSAHSVRPSERAELMRTEAAFLSQKREYATFKGRKVSAVSTQEVARTLAALEGSCRRLQSLADDTIESGGNTAWTLCTTWVDGIQGPEMLLEGAQMHLIFANRTQIVSGVGDIMSEVESQQLHGFGSSTALPEDIEQRSWWCGGSDNAFVCWRRFHIMSHHSADGGESDLYDDDDEPEVAHSLSILERFTVDTTESKFSLLERTLLLPPNVTKDCRSVTFGNLLGTAPSPTANAAVPQSAPPEVSATTNNNDDEPDTCTRSQQGQPEKCDEATDSEAGTVASGIVETVLTNVLGLA